MSETRRYVGKLIEIERPKRFESIEEHAQFICARHNWLWRIEGYDSALNFLLSGSYEFVYHAITDKLYSVTAKKTYTDESFVRLKEISGGFAFETQFYDGGTCLQDILEEGLNNLED